MSEAVAVKTVSFDLPQERYAELEQIASAYGISVDDLLAAGVSAVLLFNALDASPTAVPLILEYDDFSFHPISLDMLLSTIHLPVTGNDLPPLAPDRSQGLAQ